MTAIRRRRPGDAVVDVVLDSEETVRIHDRRVVEHRLGAGTPLAPAGLDALRRAAAFDAAELRALRLIARRPRSAAELRGRMGEWGLDDVAASGVIERLRELGQVDDRRLAVAVADSRRARGYGRRRTAGDLSRLAVDDPAAAEALAALPEDERPDAERVAHRRFGPPPYDDRTARRVVGFLARRGFGPDAVAVRGLPSSRLTRLLPLWTALDYHPMIRSRRALGVGRSWRSDRRGERAARDALPAALWPSNPGGAGDDALRSTGPDGTRSRSETRAAALELRRWAAVQRGPWPASCTRRTK